MTLEPSRSTRVSPLAFWSGWIIGILPVFAMGVSATMKITNSHAAVEGFKKFGYPHHLLMILGIVEISCAIIYLIPPTAVLGAILMTGYFGGAIATHVRVGDPGFYTPLILGMLVWLGLVLRDRRLRALIPLRS